MSRGHELSQGQTQRAPHLLAKASLKALLLSSPSLGTIVNVNYLVVSKSTRPKLQCHMVHIAMSPAATSEEKDEKDVVDRGDGREGDRTTVKRIRLGHLGKIFSIFSADFPDFLDFIDA